MLLGGEKGDQALIHVWTITLSFNLPKGKYCFAFFEKGLKWKTKSHLRVYCLNQYHFGRCNLKHALVLVSDTEPSVNVKKFWTGLWSEFGTMLVWPSLIL